MNELYLVAHKVCGEPAFDVATRMVCPKCAGHECDECDQLGWWWIIPTSGHRAYPWWSIEMDKLKTYYYDQGGQWTDRFDLHMPEMPEGLPDHYPIRATPDAPKLNLTALMPKVTPIRRRV